MEEIMARYDRWRKRADEDPDLVRELEALAGQESETADRFSRDLEFGTGGLRGVLGAGTNRMNIYTVRRASLGLARYVLGQASGEAPSIAVSYDSRIKSELFAQEAARVFASCGVKALVYPQLMPTPALSFAVRRMGCAAGVMVTASHNPAKYNGYKIYGPDGCQITLAAADAISALIAGIDPFDGVCCADERDLRGQGLIQEMPPCVETDFYDAVLAQRLEKEPAAPLKIVYTPLNGSGLVPVTAVLARAGYKDVSVVESQRDPDGNFPTCPFPNPEMPEALAEGIRCASASGADLLLATDPDCDRVGIAVRADGAYQLLTGNEAGVLLLDYICRMLTQQGKMPAAPVAVKTIVTTEMAARVAADWHVELINVLTGFKFIGEQIGLLEARGEAGRYIFGFEESYGYLSGSHVRDKDAVNACLLICDMAAWYKARGTDLARAMEELYQKYGYCVSGLSSHEFEGEEGLAVMKALMGGLRSAPPSEIGGARIVKVMDYLAKPGQETASGLPSSDVLQFLCGDETLVTVRPSGTEPKIKFYVSVTRQSREEARERLRSALEALSALARRADAAL